jgi:hypothetical protein
LRSLDAIFVRGSVDLLELARGDSALAKKASDHRPLIAALQLHAPHAKHDAHDHGRRAPTFRDP